MELGEQILLLILLISFSFKHGLSSENVNNFERLNQVVLQDIKKFFEDVHSNEKSIEFHQPHYEIPQMSSN